MTPSGLLPSTPWLCAPPSALLSGRFSGAGAAPASRLGAGSFFPHCSPTISGFSLTPLGCHGSCAICHRNHHGRQQEELIDGLGPCVHSNTWMDREDRFTLTSPCFQERWSRCGGGGPTLANLHQQGGGPSGHGEEWMLRVALSITLRYELGAMH